MSVKIGTILTAKERCHFRSKANTHSIVNVESDGIIIIIDDVDICFTALYKSELIVIDKKWLNDQYENKSWQNIFVIFLNNADCK